MVNSSLVVDALQNKSTEFDSLSSDSSCPEIATAIENSNLSKEPTVVGEYQNTEHSICTATITLEKNTHYMIVSGISERSINQAFDFSITTNSGSYEIIREAKRTPAMYTSSADGDGVYYYIIKTGADGANITISKKWSTFDVLKL